MVNTRTDYLLPRYEDRGKLIPVGTQVPRDFVDKDGMYRVSDIIPYTNEYRGDCPCNQYHLLDNRKESLSHYQGKVWSTKCAIHHLFTYMERVIREQEQYIKELENKRKEWSRKESPAELMLCAAEVQMQTRAEHLMDCRSMDPVAAIRGNNSCTCKLEEYTKVLKEVERFLNK